MGDWFFGEEKKNTNTGGGGGGAGTEEEEPTQTLCSPAFMPMDSVDPSHGPVFILGMTFLRHYKTTYVRETPNCPPKMYFEAVNEACQAVEESGVMTGGESSNKSIFID